jgi:hypothetical protein
VTEIRPLHRADLDQAAELFRKVLRPESQHDNDAVAAFLERTLLDSPIADPEIPSLVAVDDGRRIVGLIGTEVRPMRMGDRRLRLVISEHWAVDPAAPTSGLGAWLLQRVLTGPQDGTFTDTANAATQQIWERLGGETIHLQCLTWTRVFRPFGSAAALAARRLPPVRAATLARASRPLDAVVARPRRVTPPAAADEPLTPAAFLSAVPVVGERVGLLPDYDQAFVEWLLDELGRLQADGQPVARIVRGAAGAPVGWYVYWLRPGAVCHVLQIAADGRHVEQVLDNLLAHAQSHGAAALVGRLEPRLMEPLRRRRCILRLGERSLFHTRDPELLQKVRAGDTLLSRFDGEWPVHAPA